MSYKCNNIISRSTLVLDLFLYVYSCLPNRHPFIAQRKQNPFLQPLYLFHSLIPSEFRRFSYLSVIWIPPRGDKDSYELADQGMDLNQFFTPINTVCDEELHISLLIRSP